MIYYYAGMVTLSYVLLFVVDRRLTQAKKFREEGRHLYRHTVGLIEHSAKRQKMRPKASTRSSIRLTKRILPNKIYW